MFRLHGRYIARKYCARRDLEPPDSQAESEDNGGPDVYLRDWLSRVFDS